MRVTPKAFGVVLSTFPTVPARFLFPKKVSLAGNKVAAGTVLCSLTSRDFLMEHFGTIDYVPRMSQTLKERVKQLEKRVAELSGNTRASKRTKNPWRTYGAFKDDPDFEEAVRLGREYREQQTYDKEIAGS